MISCLIIFSGCTENSRKKEVSPTITITETDTCNIDSCIDYSCQTSADCKFAIPSEELKCNPCHKLNCKHFKATDEEVEAVNKNWEADCPEAPKDIICTDCIGSLSENKAEIACIDNICTKVLL